MKAAAASLKPSAAHRVAFGALALGAFAVVLVAAPFKQFDLDRHLAPKELALHVAALLAALPLLVRAMRAGAALELTFVDAALALWLMLGVVAIPFSSNWWLGERALAVSISSAAIFWSARTLGANGMRRAVLGVLATGVVVGALTALLQAYGMVSPAVAEFASLSRAPGGSFGNRNFMAHLCAIGVPILLALALTARAPRGTILPSIGMLLVGAAVFLSRTRAAWLALAVTGALALTLWFALRPWKRWPQAALGARLRAPVVAALVGAGAAAVLPNTLNWKSDNPYLDSVKGIVNTSEGSGRGRILQYRNTAKMALARPVLGVGPGNWAVQYPRWAPPNDPSLSQDDGRTSNPWPSSDWMAYLSERGVPALLVFGLALAVLGLTALVRMSRAASAEEFVTAFAMFAVLSIAATEGMFDAVLLLAVPAFYVWCAIGALAAPVEGRRVLTFSPPMWRTLLGATALVMTLVIAKSATAIAAMSVYSGATRASTFESAASLDPSNYRIRMRLATTYASRGACAQVRDHAGAAHDLFPNAAEPRRLLRACGVRLK